MKRASRLRTLILGAFCMLVSVRCWAQLSGTGLTGTVTDATGGVVADVQVLAIQDATGLRRETVSSGQGTYEITELPVGAFDVEAALDRMRLDKKSVGGKLRFVLPSSIGHVELVDSVPEGAVRSLLAETSTPR